MSSRTNHQVNIGNGSTLTVEANEEMDDETAKRLYGCMGSWVYLVARMKAKEVPSSADRPTLIRNHALAVLHFSKKDLFNEGVAFLESVPPEESIDVHYRYPVKGWLKSPDAFLQQHAPFLQRIWSIVRYVEWEEAKENKILTTKELNGGVPHKIQPHDLANQIGRRHMTQISLGLGGGKVEAIARCILQKCCYWEFWGSLDERNSALIPEGMGFKGFEGGINALREQGYIRKVEGRLYLCESFAVKCWNAALGVEKVLV